MLQFAQWCNNSRLAEAIRDSPWIFPTLEIVHLLGLAVLGGTILIVDLRLLGFGLKQLSSAQLAAQVSPWTRAALAAPERSRRTSRRCSASRHSGLENPVSESPGIPEMRTIRGGESLMGRGASRARQARDPATGREGPRSPPTGARGSVPTQ